MNTNVLVYEPVASPNRPPQQRHALQDLRGKTIGFIDNAKPNFNHLVDDIAKLLVDRHGAAGVIRHRKVRAGIPAASDAMQALTRQCDAVITGSGD